MKKKMDAGLEYVKQLNIIPAKDKRTFMEYLLRKIGPEQSTAIFEELDRRAQGYMNEEYFYDLKNTDLKSSIAFSGALDGDIIRRTCNWIADHKDLFGKTILDVGCDCGIVSCFIAKTFPESEVLAIDLSQPAVDAAQELAEKLGVTNITFKKQDVRKMMIGVRYDTVFSSRTLIPNLSISGKEDTSWELEEAGNYFSRASVSYARALVSALAPKGNLISVEKIEKNGFLLGWLKSLNGVGLNFNAEAYAELPVRELTNQTVLQCIVGARGEGMKAMDLFVKMYEDQVEFNQANYSDWMAKTAVYLKAGSLIRGIKTADEANGIYTKNALYTYKDDATLCMHAQYIGEIFQVSLYDREMQKEIIEQMKMIEETEKNSEGVKVTKL